MFISPVASNVGWEISANRNQFVSTETVRHSSPYITLSIDLLVQERRNSIANAPELRLACTKPSIYPWRYGILVEPITAEEEPVNYSNTNVTEFKAENKEMTPRHAWRH